MFDAEMSSTWMPVTHPARFGVAGLVVGRSAPRGAQVVGHPLQGGAQLAVDRPGAVPAAADVAALAPRPRHPVVAVVGAGGLGHRAGRQAVLVLHAGAGLLVQQLKRDGEEVLKKECCRCRAAEQNLGGQKEPL